MKFILGALLAAATIPSTLAHYNFDRLIVEGNVTEPYEYVRQMTNSNSPVTDVTSTDLTCNVGTLANAANTKTYSVAAGSEVGFNVRDYIGHPGPLNVYMSKAPSTAVEYDGSGEWFKIFDMGVTDFASSGPVWAASNLKQVNFTIPTEVPDGEYLLRIEHIALHSASQVGGAQFYMSCAQISVTGGGSGTPSPTIAIPGGYSASDPGILFQLYYPVPTNYTIPGPDVWPAGSDSGSSSSAVASTAASTASAVATTPTSSAAVTSAAVTSSASSVPTTLATVALSTSSSTAPTTATTTTAAPTTSDPADDECEI